MIEDSDDILIWGVIPEQEKDHETESESNDVKDIMVDSEDSSMPSDSEVAEIDDNILDIEESDNSVYEKKYYKISEVESLIGESQSTIRFWEDSFSELGKNFCSQRSRGGTRKFTKENIENLKLLKVLLRDRRLTIEGAIVEIKSEKKRNAKERALILLNETKEELNNLIDAYNYILHTKC